ncbi:VOC family protein [Mycolicibacterium confluentis]|uniref:Glyoxalase n=1 Tax=Mycolicibacterium confluentis TaxID=28047 RepID=A0A7I7XR38_9MYCO|nr:VOC family protein [Mycolicibacterium confluentis]MCV7322569.1 VOC family protein [Mycolicibacterium confluentis]ORV21416.1 glyoxalase [Mycolicibacterium confluentis]BBZ31688.1 glyoxalase [Mycolicibacterium confluentis]
MTLSVAMVTVDTHDPDRLAAWWAEAVGGTTSPVMPGEFVTVTLPDGGNLGFQRVDDPTPGKNRVHVDFTDDDIDAAVARLVSLGAVEKARQSFGDEFAWVVLEDPDGNAFCVAAGH